MATAAAPAGLTSPVTFQRDTDVILIPWGDTFVVPKGTIGSVIQELGGNFVVQIETGYQVRVAGADAEAIGREATAPPCAALEGASTEECVWEQLRTVYDPEIPVDIVELGLIYDIEVMPTADDRAHIDVQMTLTAPGCGMGQILIDDVVRAVSVVPGVADVVVDLVFDPPWSPERMSDTAKLQLGIDDF